MMKERLERTGLFELNQHGHMVAGNDRLSVGVCFSPDGAEVYMVTQDVVTDLPNIQTVAQLYAFTVQLLGLDDEITPEKLKAAGFVDEDDDGRILRLGDDEEPNLYVYFSWGKMRDVLASSKEAYGVDTMSALLLLCEAFGLGDLLFAEPVKA